MTARSTPDCNSSDAQAPTLCIWKQQAFIASLRLTSPSFEYGNGRLGQRRTAFLAPLAEDPHVSTAFKHQIVAFGPRDLRQSQTRLDRHQDKRVIAPPEPGAPIVGSEQTSYFLTHKETDERAWEAFAGDGKHTLDLCRVSWQFESSVMKEMSG